MSLELHARSYPNKSNKKNIKVTENEPLMNNSGGMGGFTSGRSSRSSSIGSIANETMDYKIDYERVFNFRSNKNYRKYGILLFCSIILYGFSFILMRDSMWSTWMQNDESSCYWLSDDDAVPDCVDPIGVACALIHMILVPICIILFFISLSGLLSYRVPNYSQIAQNETVYDANKTNDQSIANSNYNSEPTAHDNINSIGNINSINHSSDKLISRHFSDTIKRSQNYNFETRMPLPITCLLMVVLMVIGFAGALFILFDWDATMYFTLEERSTVYFPRVLLAIYCFYIIMVFIVLISCVMKRDHLFTKLTYALTGLTNKSSNDNNNNKNHNNNNESSVNVTVTEYADMDDGNNGCFGKCYANCCHTSHFGCVCCFCSNDSRRDKIISSWCWLIIFLPIIFFVCTLSPTLWHSNPGNYYPSGFYSWWQYESSDPWTINWQIKSGNVATHTHIITNHTHSKPSRNTSMNMNERESRRRTLENDTYEFEAIIAKIFPDLIIYYGWFFIVSCVAFAAVFVPSMRKKMNERMFLIRENSILPALYPTFGDILFIGSFVIMFLLQSYYWFVIHSYHGEDKNWKEEWARAFGILGSMVYALAFLPITRHQSNNNVFGSHSLFNNPFHKLFGLSFEFILNYHKCMGILFVFLGILHLLWWEWFLIDSGNYSDCQFMSLSSCLYSGNNPAINSQYYIFVVGIIPVYMFLPNYWFRRFKFELFYYSHVIGGFIILGGMLWHCNNLIYFLYPNIIFYIFDRLNRWFMSNRQINVIDCKIVQNKIVKLDFVIDGVKYDDYVQLHENGNNCNFIRDDFIFLKIDQLSMYQWHPFSIFSVSCDTVSGDAIYSICIKNSGDYTKQLVNLVNEIDSNCANNSNNNVSYKNAISFGVTTFVDGPYGHEIDVLQYNSIFLVAGGIGITPIHFMFDTLADRNNNFFNNNNNKSPLNVVLIWCFRDENLIDLCKETFEKSREMSNFHVFLFNTSQLGGNNGVNIGQASEKPIAREKGYMLLHNGRPDLDSFIVDYCNDLDLNINDKSSMSQSLLYCCGPQTMVQTCQEISMQYGMQFGKETFLL